MESKRAIIRRAILNTLEGIRKGDMLHAKRAILHALKGGCMGEIETEGLGMMAHDMGYECWGMPNLEIRHRDS